MEIKEKLIEIVGKKYFFDSIEKLKEYSKDYSLTPPGMPNYVVQPKDSKEIQKLVLLANESLLPIIPCSSKVHFTGGTVPKEGGIILDMSRMDKIVVVDERNRYARIEPGVTWKQLATELDQHNFMALNPLLPHANQSALTSHLETAPMLLASCYEFAEPLLTMELIYPDGEFFRTGSASVAGVETFSNVTKGVCPYGPGMDWFRLFLNAQGTMGVVTWGHIKIEHKPLKSKLFFIPFKKIDTAIECMYRLQRRAMGYECLLLDNHNLATILAEDLDGIESLKEKIPPYTIVLVLAGGLRRPEEKIEYEEEVLREISREYVDVRIMTQLPVTLGAENLIDMLRKPWPEEKVYWKHIYKGCCQDLSFTTTMEKVPEFAKAVNEIAARHAYPIGDVGLYVQPIEVGRACHCEFNFFYDPDSIKDVEKIRGLFTDAAETVLDLGALFTKPYGELADLVYSRASSYTWALKKVKNFFDPNNIMNSGNLCF
jgi:FAD/FMN-containing dehydrogenase